MNKPWNGMTKDEILAELVKVNDDLSVIVLQVDSFAGAFRVEDIEFVDGQIVITIDK